MKKQVARTLKALTLSFASQILAWLILITTLGAAKYPYDFFYLSDISVYYSYAAKIASGLTPYAQLYIEYPPLAVPLFTLPGNLSSPEDYQWRFAAIMIISSIATGIVTTATASLLFPTDNRPYKVAALFAIGTLLTGAIIANRYDAVVALVFATVLLLLVARKPALAALVLGLGFSVKITPVVLLPLVLIVSKGMRNALRSLSAFAITAAAPFLLVRGSGGISGLHYLFRYHLVRPLQIETLFASPLMYAASQGWTRGRIETQFGSQVLIAPGTDIAASIAAPATTLIALGLAYWLIWRRRELIRSTPRTIAIAMLGVLLGLITFSKVLSPQYLIWPLPLIALITVNRPWIGAILYTASLLTQVVFPANYFAFAGLTPGPILVVALRNALLVTAFALVAWNLWKLPKSHPKP